MPSEPTSLLLVEDSDADADLLRDMHEHSPLRDRPLARVRTLAETTERLQADRFSVVLLDLNLPDSDYTETVPRVCRAAPTTPVVVLSGTEDDRAITGALRCGAQDFLVKGRFDADLLRRAVTHAIERQRLVNDLAEERRERERLHREYTRLESALVARTDADSAAFGTLPAWRSSPEDFATIQSLYEQLLDDLLNRRSVKSEADAQAIGRTLDEIEEQLGELRATPRDVLDLHSETLRQKTLDINPRRSMAYVEEGRYLLVQLMGRLANYYRRHPILVKVHEHGSTDDGTSPNGDGGRAT